MIGRFVAVFNELRVSEKVFDSKFRKGEPVREVG